MLSVPNATRSRRLPSFVLFMIKDRIPSCEIHRYPHAKPSEYVYAKDVVFCSSGCCERFVKESSLLLFENSLALLLQKNRYKDGKSLVRSFNPFRNFAYNIVNKIFLLTCPSEIISLRHCRREGNITSSSFSTPYVVGETFVTKNTTLFILHV